MSYHLSAEPEKILRVESRSQSVVETLQLPNGHGEVEAIHAKIIDLHRLCRISALEHYINGNFALVFDVPTKWDRNVVGERKVGSPRNDGLGFSHFIFHLSLADAAVLESWGQEPVLVLPVDIVNGPDGVIPSVIRLYV